jgi:hypothetical protein
MSRIELVPSNNCLFQMLGTLRFFQSRNEDFCPRPGKSRDCSAAARDTPHKRLHRLTPILVKKTICGWKRANKLIN